MARPGIRGILLITQKTCPPTPLPFQPHMDMRGKNPNMEKAPRDTLPKGDQILRSFRKFLASLQMEIGQ